ncbi:MAG: hypothetical protein M3N31_07390 [Actinomycetota bacterium]|nr:hypothetical protein [Actinomycetota bacterium]
MQPTVVGLLVGLILGLTLVLEGFPQMLVVALFGALGFLAMKVVEGEIDLTEYLGGRNRRQP